MNRLWKSYPFLRQQLDDFEEFLIKSLQARQPLIHKAITELTRAGGKRIRPALVLATGQMTKKSSLKDLFPVAAAVEILHMATLVHDDIIDEAKLRRGVITTQYKYGKDVAVFTGDYLFSQAFLMLSGEVEPEVLKRVAKAVKYICEGEIDQFENRYNLDVSNLKYFKRIRRKTAILFQASCFTGSHLAKLTNSQQYSLSKYGKYLGMIFQITDDILDVVSTEKTTGKPVGNDFSQGVYTLPIIYALQDNKVGPVLKEVLKREKIDKEEVIGLIHRTDALAKTRKIVNLYVQKAQRELTKFPEKESIKFMSDLLQIVAERNY